jgi:UDP-sugar diphosphatase
MDNREIIDIKRVKEPKHTKVYEITYKEDGKIKRKEVAKKLDTAKILVYHKSKDAFVLVKQFRAFVYINHPSLAVRYELCGGRADKDISIEEIAKEEVLEELGYQVKKIEKITTLVTVSKMHLFYAEVDDEDRVNSGGGVDYETISVEYLPVSKAKEFMFDESKPKRPGLMFCFCWWMNMKNSNNK